MGFGCCGVGRELISRLGNRLQKQAYVFVCALEAVEWGFGLMAQKVTLPGRIWPVRVIKGDTLSWNNTLRPRQIGIFRGICPGAKSSFCYLTAPTVDAQS